MWQLGGASRTYRRTRVTSGILLSPVNDDQKALQPMRDSHPYLLGWFQYFSVRSLLCGALGGSLPQVRVPFALEVWGWSFG